MPDFLQTFLNGDKELPALMRAHDWSASSLGPPAMWPQSLRSIVELMLNSKFPMFLAWGPELCFLYNDAYARILGAKHPSALGRRFQDVWFEIWDDLLPLVKQAMAGEAVYHENLALTMRRHGYDEPVWFTFSYSPVRDESGDVAGMYCACFETTEQVLAEAYRNAENERFRTLFEQAPSFMAILRGRDHVFDLTNQAYLQLVGHRRILGKPAREALPEVVDQGFVDLLDRVYATGEPFVGLAALVKLQRESGGPLEERYLDFVFQPVRDARGVVTAIFVVGSDVTERKQADEELRQLANDLTLANQRQNEFLATLAHELRNPLAPIRTGLDLMRVTGDSPGSSTRVREVMQRQVDHLVHLIDDLLDLARISTGKIVPRKTLVKLVDILQRAVETALPGIQAKNQDFRMRVPEEPIWVDADASRMAQVFGNVLTNAQKYTPENGKIDLSVRLDGGEVVVAISDSGIGIPADSLQYIFDMFAQVEHGAEHTQGGLGIGLSLVKWLTEKHDGTVSASSAGPGLGATFTIRLPVAQPKPAQVFSTRDDANIGPLQPIRILIADDNQDAAELLKSLLETQGHIVDVAADGVSALELAREFRPDLALLDIGMPKMNGFELAIAIRQEPQLQLTRLAAVTGWGAREDRDRTRQAGFEFHLTKPVSFEALSGLLTDIRASR